MVVNENVNWTVMVVNENVNWTVMVVNENVNWTVMVVNENVNWTVMVAVIVNYSNANCLHTIAFNNQEGEFYNSIVYKKKSSFFDHLFPSTSGRPDPRPPRCPVQ